VANLTDGPISDPSLTLPDGPLCGTPRADVLLGAASADAPVVTGTGGFSGYVPVDHLDPRQVVVVRLSP